MTPREFFPELPDEAYEMWLAPFVARVGWPFQNPDAPVSGTRWEYLLANIPLVQWHAYRWELRSIELTPQALAHSSLMKVDDILQHCTRGALTMTANLENTQERFRACAEYVAEHGRVPLPLVAIPRHGRLEIVDGHHRLGALRLHGLLEGGALAYVAG